jgi:putative ABC transport system permease protein
VLRFLLELLEGWRIAVRAIWANKSRALLTTLGIIIGITSVTAMATVINGLDRQFEKTLSSLGTDVLYISKWPWGNGPGFDWWNYINRPQIEPGLADVVREQARYAAAVAPLVDTDRTAARKEKSLQVEVTGSTPTYGRIRNVSLAEGRFFTETDERAARNVCVIGHLVARELFPIATPLGKSIRLGGKPCTVIGVQTEVGKGLFGENREDTRVVMPFATFKKLFGLSRWRNVDIMVQVRSLGMMDRAEDELIGLARTARRVPPGEENNFEINDQDSVRQNFASTKLAIYGVGLTLASLALVVGGIGVMNIMFVSVKERTREIGVRKAVGAKKRAVLLQFLLEAIVICLLGGVMGVAGAFGLQAVLEGVLGLATALPVSTLVLAFSICVGVGILAGLAPAWQAARIEPIRALRYE